MQIIREQLGLQNPTYIGAGNYGRVYSAKDTYGTYVAIKVQNVQDYQNQEFAAAGILNQIPCNYFIKTFGQKKFGDRVFLVMEFCNMGGLDVSIKKSLMPRASILMQFLKLFHEQGLVHCNIKPSNILFASTDETQGTLPKLTELHFTFHLKLEKEEEIMIMELISGCLGFTLYMLATGKPIDHPSYGMLRVTGLVLPPELAEQSQPQARAPQTSYQRVSNANLNELLLDRNGKKLSETMGIEFVQLLSRMLTYEPSQRHSAAQLLQNFIFTNPRTGNLDVIPNAFVEELGFGVQEHNLLLSRYATPGQKLTTIALDQQVPQSITQTQIQSSSSSSSYPEQLSPYNNPNSKMNSQTVSSSSQSSVSTYQSSQSSSSKSRFNTSWKKSDFKREGKLGKGGFGAVWYMKEKATSLQVAVKEMDYYTDEEKKMVKREIEMMQNVYGIVLQSNPSSQFLHIVQPLGFFEDEDEGKGYLVLEYCSKGDLRKYIQNMKKTRTEITPQFGYEMIGQIAVSLFQLHACGILHSGLKPENVLLNEGFKVKLADFGLSRQLQVGRECTTNHGGSFLYQGPEGLRNRNCAEGGKTKEQSSQQKIIQTIASDIWAFGVMMFELLAQRHPFFDNKFEGDISAEEFIHRVIYLPPAELPEHYPLKLKNLIRRMLEKDPSKRISAQQILEIPEVAAALVDN
ncbi:MAG: putative aurora kinase [Streblomastix strix]|uniref:Putative aurora kinase n=1 Tax=Streblomastix strix TaxID=222440 RepID=A0A5J4W426_9EUKA|nr:MAG: putative aurora kinase [Streblomastix strix]